MSLLIDSATASPPRVTYDVDLIAEVAALRDYHVLEKALAQRGFARDLSPDAPICRWTVGAVKVALRDTEQVPLLEEGGIEVFIRPEVLPHTPDAWIKEDATRIGYEVSFTRHFYKPQPQPQPQRTLQEISADILVIEKETEGLLDGLLKGAKP